jgi:hypothetical protein
LKYLINKTKIYKYFEFASPEKYFKLIFKIKIRQNAHYSE